MKRTTATIIATIIFAIALLIFGPVITFFIGWFVGWLTSLIIGGLVTQGFSLFGLNITPDQLPLLFGAIGTLVSFIVAFCKNIFNTNSKNN